MRGVEPDAIRLRIRAASSIFGGALGGAAQQARVAAEQLQQKLRSVDQVSEGYVKTQAVAACPHCNARVEGGAKFCPECGEPRK